MKADQIAALMRALTWAGWMPDDRITARFHLIYRHATQERRLFLGVHSGQCHVGKRWGDATPLPLDWPDKIISRHRAAQAQRPLTNARKLLQLIGAAK